MGPRMFVERKVLLHTNNAVKRRHQKFPGILRGFLPRSYKFDARLDSKKNWLSDNWVRIQSKLGLVELKDEDRVIWSASKSGKFTHAATWEELTKKDKWCGGDWSGSSLHFSNVHLEDGRQSKISFWNGATLGKLPVCLIKTHRKQEPSVLECSFTKRIWEGIMVFCLISEPQNNWEELMDGELFI